MRFLQLGFILTVTCALAGGRVRAADDAIEASRATFNKWVDVRESIARDRRDWAVEKEFLSEEIRLLREEISALTEKSERLEKETSQTEKDLADIAKKNEDLKKASAQVETAAAQFEKSIRELHPRFPEVLQDTLKPLIGRLPSGGGKSKSGIGERMQAVVGVLSQVDKFNGTLTTVPELRKNPEGRDVQVQTLYLGLAQAWFVGLDKSFAGRGVPGPEGWVWTSDANASDVKTAIDIQQNAGVARYVDLPVTVR